MLLAAGGYFQHKAAEVSCPAESLHSCVGCTPGVTGVAGIRARCALKNWWALLAESWLSGLETLVPATQAGRRATLHRRGRGEESLGGAWLSVGHPGAILMPALRGGPRSGPGT